jgi:hypothetical protein
MKVIGYLAIVLIINGLVASSVVKNDGSITIDRVVLNGDSLSVDVSLNIFDSDLEFGVDVALSVLVFSNSNMLLDRVIPVSFSGITRETLPVHINSPGLNAENNVILFLDLVNLNIPAHSGINMHLDNNKLFSLVDGFALPLEASVFENMYQM